MPYKVYHGKTGVIYNVTKSAVGVIIYKKVGNRYIEKRVNVRVEHIASSRSREECKSCATPHEVHLRKAPWQNMIFTRILTLSPNQS
jgi:large subunit ribosomal protein L21e